MWLQLSLFSFWTLLVSLSLVVLLTLMICVIVVRIYRSGKKW